MEVIKEKHPRDQMFFPQFQLHLPMPLDEMLDPRLPPDPLFDVQSKLVSIMKVAFSCLTGNPESRLIIKSFKDLPSFLIVAHVHYTYHAYAGLNSEQKNVSS